MRLFLAAEAKSILDELEKFLGKSLAKYKIAYVVTAANGEMGYGSWRGSETLKVVRNSGAKVTVVELENYKFEDPIAKIKSHDIVWFAGGMSGYLLYWIRRVRLDKELPKLLDSGIIYVGSSAGSMICGPTNYAASRFPDTGETGAEVIPGLNYIDFEICPHYEESQLPMIKKCWKFGKLCLLKNGEAITVVDGKVTILGEERFIER